MSKINDYGENTAANESDVYIQETSNGTRKITFSTISNGILSKFLKSTTKSSLSAANKGSASSREYAVGLDANGKMSVNVPWSDTNTVTTVVNNLNSTSTTSALSAAQGRYLQREINDLDNKLVIVTVAETWSGSVHAYIDNELISKLSNGYKLVNVVNNYGASSVSEYGMSYILPSFRVPTDKTSIIVASDGGTSINQAVKLDFVFAKF
jgi:hypothetical protein